jgi:uncharacterized membrane protein
MQHDNAQARNEKLVAAALLGGAAGLRCITPVAAVTTAGRLGVDQRLRNAALIAAAGELLTDKLPWTPNRTSRLPYAGRVASGALCGWSVAGRRGALVGAAAATKTTFVGFHVRRLAARRSSKLRAALREDVVALGAAGLAVLLSAE